MQAQKSTVSCEEDVRKRLEAANFQTLPSEDKEYVAHIANVSKRQRIDSGETLNVMAKGSKVFSTLQ